MSTQRKPKQSFIVSGDDGNILALDTTTERALDDYRAKFAQAVSLDDAALADYPGDTPQARAESALNSGDVAIVDGKGHVWVDPHECLTEYPSMRAAMKAYYRRLLLPKDRNGVPL